NVERAARGAEHRAAAVAVDDLGLVPQHQDDRPVQRQGGQGLIGGVEQQDLAHYRAFPYCARIRGDMPRHVPAIVPSWGTRASVTVDLRRTARRVVTTAPSCHPVWRLHRGPRHPKKSLPGMTSGTHDTFYARSTSTLRMPVGSRVRSMTREPY